MEELLHGEALFGGGEKRSDGLGEEANEETGEEEPGTGLSGVPGYAGEERTMPKEGEGEPGGDERDEVGEDVGGELEALVGKVLQERARVKEGQNQGF